MLFLKNLFTIAFFLVILETFAFVPLLTWRLVQKADQSTSTELLLCFLFSGLLAFFLYCFHRPILHTIKLLCSNNLAKLSSRNWLILLIVVGLLLRLFWLLFYPAQPASDGNIYFLLATALSEGKPYYIANSYAFWPPGYALFLTPFFELFGADILVVRVLNCLLFVFSLLTVYALSMLVANERSARLASLLFCLWPSYLTTVGLPIKEGLLVFTLLLAVFLFLKSAKQKKSGLPTVFLSSLFLGYTSLIQPGFLLFPTVFLAYELIRGTNFLRIVLRLSVLLLGMALVIGPWTFRNYQVFDELVLISSGGGDVLNRANNATATGGYQRGDYDPSLSELEVSKRGYQQAKTWILENPHDFLHLVLKKHILFLGDDSYGVYETLRRGSLTPSELEYALWKGIAVLFWLGCWMLVFLFLVQAFKRKTLSADQALLLVAVLYPFVIHSVFESGEKYHLAIIGILAVIASFSASESQDHL